MQFWLYTLDKWSYVKAFQEVLLDIPDSHKCLTVHRLHCRLEAGPLSDCVCVSELHMQGPNHRPAEAHSLLERVSPDGTQKAASPRV